MWVAVFGDEVQRASQSDVAYTKLVDIIQRVLGHNRRS